MLPSQTQYKIKSF